MTADHRPSTEIVVCLKWVAIRPEIDPLSGAVTTDERFSGLSPADRAALEWALRLGEVRNVPVTAVSVGAAQADTGLREALAHGAAGVERIHCEDPERLGSRTVALALAERCRPASMVLCGDHSLDRGSGSVPAFLAHALGFGQALGCVGLESESGLPSEPLIAERRLDQGRRERLAIGRHTVLSFEGGLELRRASLAATVESTTATIPILDITTTPGVTTTTTVVATGPYRPRARILPGPTGSTMERIQRLTGVGQERQANQQLELEPVEAAEEVIRRLQRWGYLD